MTISVAELLEKCGLEWAGAVQWGEQIHLDQPGVYVVSSTADLEDSVGLLPLYKPDPASFKDLRQLCPEVMIDGTPATDEALAQRIGAFWIQDSPVLYIGLAGTSAQKRVRQYYVTRIGQRSPHAGGWWLKTLSGLADLYVHYAPASDPAAAESALLNAYAESVPVAVRRQLFDAERIAPFANVNVRHGLRKRHGLAGYKIERSANDSASPSMRLQSAAPAAQEPLPPSARSHEASKASHSDGIRIESQAITDADRTRSNLRIPARSKFALPPTDGFLTVNYGGTSSEARWRVNGSRSGTIGLGKKIMRTLGSPGQSVWMTVRGTIVEIEG
ncbi:hypothetical protein [Arthrobacter sp. ZGTC131]|uniref:hypothetical protein n=1 Tax=Arthrobacter sp. ZGTC131 TaxID=2058898 RepID=UPI0011AFEEF4|nr:hypothetical protein [Arthrobacter sp. ZGTC131]